MALGQKLLIKVIPAVQIHGAVDKWGPIVSRVAIAGARSGNANSLSHVRVVIDRDASAKNVP